MQRAKYESAPYTLDLTGYGAPRGEQLVKRLLDSASSGRPPSSLASQLERQGATHRRDRGMPRLASTVLLSGELSE